jgi:hypothetical protein
VNIYWIIILPVGVGGSEIQRQMERLHVNRSLDSISGHLTYLEGGKAWKINVYLFMGSGYQFADWLGIYRRVTLENFG